MRPIKSKMLTIEMDLSKLNKRTTERVVNAVKFGAKAWIRAAESVIPVYSGASRASLDQLAAVFNMNIATSPTRNAIARLGPARIARRQAQARSESRGGLRVNKKSVTFFYESTLQWLVDNELGDINDDVAKSGRLITAIPYNFIDFANRAAQGVIAKRLRGRTIDLTGILKLKIVR